MRFANLLRTLATLVAAFLVTTAAQAQLFRAYVASSGNDAEPCTLPRPCRLLPAALAAVADGGEIWILDSANYNTATVGITKSVTILAVPGAIGSVVAAGGPAIAIATANVKVALRNLVIVPFPSGGGTHGISMTNGSSLAVENCLLARLPNFGIYVFANASLRVVDSVIRDNSSGIFLGGGATATVAGARILGNANDGVIVFGSLAGTVTTAAVSDSVFSGNGAGVNAYATNATATARASVARSTLSDGIYGIYVDGGPGTQIVTAGANLVTGNLTGFFRSSGSGTSTLKSRGDNTLDQNSQNTFGTITALAGT